MDKGSLQVEELQKAGVNYTRMAKLLESRKPIGRVVLRISTVLPNKEVKCNIQWANYIFVPEFVQIFRAIVA